MKCFYNKLESCFYFLLPLLIFLPLLSLNCLQQFKCYSTKFSNFTWTNQWLKREVRVQCPHPDL